MNYDLALQTIISPLKATHTNNKQKTFDIYALQISCRKGAAESIYLSLVSKELKMKFMRCHRQAFKVQ